MTIVSHALWSNFVSLTNILRCYIFVSVSQRFHLCSTVMIWLCSWPQTIFVFFHPRCFHGRKKPPRFISSRILFVFIPRNNEVGGGYKNEFHLCGGWWLSFLFFVVIIICYWVHPICSACNFMELHIDCHFGIMVCHSCVRFTNMWRQTQYWLIFSTGIQQFIMVVSSH